MFEKNDENMINERLKKLNDASEISKNNSKKMMEMLEKLRKK